MREAALSFMLAPMEPTSDYCLLYVTCGSADEAERIAQTLLEERHIACANILPPTRSLYRWQGKDCTAEEVVMLLKTRCDTAQDVHATILRLHSYDTPCILTLPVAAGHAPFLRWVDAALAEEKA